MKRALDWILFVCQLVRPQHKWLMITGAGAGEQLDIAKVQAKPASEWRTHKVNESIDHLELRARHLLRCVGIHSDALHLVSKKLIRFKPGTSAQRPHFDMPVYEKAKERYAVFLFMTRGPTTRVWKGTKEVMRKLFTHHDDEATQEEEAFAKEHVITRNFHNFECEEGQLLVTRQTLLHYGPKNTTGRMRYVYFMLFSPDPRDKDEEDYTQRFPLGSDGTMLDSARS